VDVTLHAGQPNSDFGIELVKVMQGPTAQLKCYGLLLKPTKPGAYCATSVYGEYGLKVISADYRLQSAVISCPIRLMQPP